MIMRTGDLKPDLKITLSDSDVGVDVTDATVRIIGARGNTKVIDREPDAVLVTGTGAATTSQLTLLWQNGETDDDGRIDIEVEVTWPGNKPQSFEPGHVDIRTDLDKRTTP
jgi:hypothetical protein